MKRTSQIELGERVVRALVMENTRIAGAPSLVDREFCHPRRMQPCRLIHPVTRNLDAQIGAHAPFSPRDVRRIEASR